MAVDVSNVDFGSVEQVTDIKPQPDVILGENEHYFGSLGTEGKRLLLELLEETDENEAPEDRIFRRLGVGFTHAEWNGYDLFWAVGGAEALVDALEDWNSARNL